MDLINWIFTVGNLLLLIAAFPLIKTVWSNRETLKDFHPLGATMTFLGVVTFNVAYVLMANWWSIILSSTTVAFWALAMICNARVVFPEASGPKISVTLPRGSPPIPSAMSRENEPVEIHGTFLGSSESPSRMMAPSPNSFRI